MAQEITQFYRTKKNVLDVHKQMFPMLNAHVVVIKPALNTTFGNIRYYAADPVQKAALWDLTGTRTLLPMHLNALRALGFEIVEAHEQIRL